jgi:O-antigen/teichoic acid export membrane protein
MTPDSGKSRHIFNRVFYNTISNFAGNFVVLGLGFITTPFILSHLGTIHYGLWILVGSIVAYGSLLDLGIGGAVVKFTAEFRAKGDKQFINDIISTALWLYSTLGLIVIVLASILAPIFADIFKVSQAERMTATMLVLVSGISIGISIPCTLTSAVLKGLQRFDYANLVSSIGALLSLASIVAVLLGGLGVVWMAAVNIPVMLIMQVFSIFLIKKNDPDINFHWRGAKRSLVRTIISFSSPLLILDISGRLQNKSDELVIGAFLPMSFVTPYYLARRLSELPKLFTDQFLKVLLPIASELDADNDQQRLKSLYLTSTRLTLAIFLPIGISLAILSKDILRAWVGSEYVNYSYLVVILTLASLIDTSQWPAGSVLQGMARHQPIAIMSLGSALANLTLSLFLIGRLGLLGVALGTLLPTLVECLGFVLPFTLKVVKVDLTEAIKQMVLPTFIPVIPAATILLIISRVLDLSSLPVLIIAFSASCLTYSLGYLMIGASRYEKQVLVSTIQTSFRMINTFVKHPEINDHEVR